MFDIFASKMTAMFRPAPKEVFMSASAESPTNTGLLKAEGK